jgi:hypothetical protein
MFSCGDIKRNLFAQRTTTLRTSKLLNFLQQLRRACSEIDSGYKSADVGASDKFTLYHVETHDTLLNLLQSDNAFRQSIHHVVEMPSANPSTT